MTYVITRKGTEIQWTDVLAHYDYNVRVIALNGMTIQDLFCWRSVTSSVRRYVHSRLVMGMHMRIFLFDVHALKARCMHDVQLLMFSSLQEMTLSVRYISSIQSNSIRF